VIPQHQKTCKKEFGVHISLSWNFLKVQDNYLSFENVWKLTIILKTFYNKINYFYI